MVKIVAVAGGTGGLGKLIVEALAAHSNELKVIILSRTPGDSNAVVVDYDQQSTLEQALRGVDYVVCALGSLAVGPEQRSLMQAAKKNNVRRFYPSEFGMDTNEHSLQVLQAKVDAAKYAHELELPITRVMTGFFIDTIFLPWFHIDLAHNKASIVGDGNQAVSFTHRKDVGRLLTQLILDDSKEEVIRTGTETKTLNEAFAVYEQIKKSKLQITKETVQAVQERVKQPGMDMMAMAVDCLRMAIAEGKASNKPPLYTGNLKNFITLSDYFSSLSN